MTKLSPRVTARKPYVPPKLTYFGQMNEIVMESLLGSAPILRDSEEAVLLGTEPGDL